MLRILTERRKISIWYNTYMHKNYWFLVLVVFILLGIGFYLGWLDNGPA
jgi:hypothetical protein